MDISADAAGRTGAGCRKRQRRAAQTREINGRGSTRKKRTKKLNTDISAAASAAVALCGNCAIYQTTYTGGDMTTPTITCPGKPMVLMVCESDGAPALIAWRGMPTTSTSSSSYEYTITWGERTVSWLLGKNHDGNMNWSGKQYHALVLLDMSAE